ncbi:hypothetical protein [Leptolyngbya sp. FACHB-16]|uniref:hypothetical protein n=1 Tax=unclassified Leptolyngbya TaxID=2650499 RepID=UPI0016867654|nr:hypothetical protein [Leptolyngbya sp. FACHB-16]MBD2152964.1 hypothetical protein [Leptolyngbya sp. FACHB-16]
MLAEGSAIPPQVYAPIVAKGARRVAAVDALSDSYTFPTVSEQIVCPFTFYLNGQLRQGIRYANELYALVQEFSPEQRSLAYQKATNLAEQGQTVVITVSSSQYQSWISLRSPDCLRYFLFSP